MEAKDLRIGNYLQFKKSLIDVYGLHEEKTYNHIVEHNYFDNETEDIEPIPLTEEWLLKFGFVEKGIYFEKWKLRIEPFILTENIFCVRLITSPIFVVYIIPYSSIEMSNIKYVHQLQNLYFALTNEELTI